MCLEACRVPFAIFNPTNRPINSNLQSLISNPQSLGRGSPSTIPVPGRASWNDCRIPPLPFSPYFPPFPLSCRPLSLPSLLSALFSGLSAYPCIQKAPSKRKVLPKSTPKGYPKRLENASKRDYRIGLILDTIFLPFFHDFRCEKVWEKCEENFADFSSM